MEGVQRLSEVEIEAFLDDLDKNKDGFIEYSEIDIKLKEVHTEIVKKVRKHHLHHQDRDKKDRDEFLRSVLGSEKDRIPRAEFAESVRAWKIPSLEQDKKAAKDEDDFMKSLPPWRRFRTYWAVKGPEMMFIALVVSLQVAFGVWQLVKYTTTPKYRETFGWGVVMAKTSAGTLYPTLFFVLLSMSRYLATFLRRFKHISRVINWDVSQSFHVKISIAAICLATLHALGHLTGSFVFASWPSQEEKLAALLGPDAVPRPYIRSVQSLPGFTGLTAYGLFLTLALLSMPVVRRWSFEVFQLGHLLMFPIMGLLAAHGTAQLLQFPMLGYWIAFPALLVLIERILRVVQGFNRIPAKLKVLDADTVCVIASIPKYRPWPYKAGQYVFLQVPSISFFQWHPFTISACAGNEMKVHIKAAGDWTNKLHSMGTEGQSIDIKVGIDGPFGAPAQRFYDFDKSIVVGAGIGVTPFSGILTDLKLREEERQESKEGHNEDDAEISRTSSTSEETRRVDFHWLVRDRNYLMWFSELLNELSRKRTSTPNLDLRIQTHVTQKRKHISTHIFRWLLEQHRTEAHPVSPLTGLINPTHFGRPDLQRIMSAHYDDMRMSLSTREKKMHGDLKVGVFFCGPPVIGYQLADLCNIMTARGRDDGSRIEYHFMMEVF